MSHALITKLKNKIKFDAFALIVTDCDTSVMAAIKKFSLVQSTYCANGM